MIKIYNEDCFQTMDRTIERNGKISVVLTSPPYNTGRPSTSERARKENESRYDIYLDSKTPDEYIEWSVDMFNRFDKMLVGNGVILYNISYSSDTTGGEDSCDLVWRVISHIIEETDFTVADRIIWKKNSALPNNTSHNKLTRICEDVFVFCRKGERKTYFCNKPVSKVSERGQKYYTPIYNFVSAKNNDGPCKYNKATYSTELCEKLLSIYAPDGGTVYDPFMGSGTTAAACVKMGLNCIGSEMSENQVQYAEDRIGKLEEEICKTQINLF